MGDLSGRDFDVYYKWKKTYYIPTYAIYYFTFVHVCKCVHA